MVIVLVGLVIGYYLGYKKVFVHKEAVQSYILGPIALAVVGGFFGFLFSYWIATTFSVSSNLIPWVFVK
jgi:hypothetical protein